MTYFFNMKLRLKFREKTLKNSDFKITGRIPRDPRPVHRQEGRLRRWHRWLPRCKDDLLRRHHRLRIVALHPALMGLHDAAVGIGRDGGPVRIDEGVHGFGLAAAAPLPAACSSAARASIFACCRAAASAAWRSSFAWQARSRARRSSRRARALGNVSRPSNSSAGRQFA